MGQKRHGLLPRDATQADPGGATGWDFPLFKDAMPGVFNNKNGAGWRTSVKPKDGMVIFAI